MAGLTSQRAAVGVESGALHRAGGGGWKGERVHQYIQVATCLHCCVQYGVIFFFFFFFVTSLEESNPLDGHNRVELGRWNQELIPVLMKAVQKIDD